MVSIEDSFDFKVEVNYIKVEVGDIYKEKFHHKVCFDLLYFTSDFYYYISHSCSEQNQSWYSQYQHWCWHYLLWSPCQFWSFYFLCCESSHLSYWSTSATPEGVWEVVQRNLREVLFSILFILFHNSNIISNIVVFLKLVNSLILK